MMSLLTNPDIIQFIKYALAGGVSAVIHITAFHLACWRLFPALQENDFAVKYCKLTPSDVDDATRSKNSMLGNTVAFFISNTVCYLINVAWVFESGRHNIFVEILLFYAVSGISVFLGTLLMGGLIRRFHMLTTWAFSANIITAVLFNYALRKFFIFAG